MKAKIFFSAERNGKTTKLREMCSEKMSEETNNIAWINPRFVKPNVFEKSIKWTRNISANIELLIIDDAPENFNFKPFCDILKAGYFPLYQGKYKPLKIVSVPEIIISTNYRPTNIDHDFFELYEFPDITNPVT